MADLRTAAQQALEALEALDAPPSGVVDHYELERRKQALRAVLAQQEPPTITFGEIRAALAQQEPVAWRFKGMMGMPWSLSDDGYYASCKRDKGYIVEPLYAHPPRREWQGLSDEEINDGRDQLPTEDLCNWSFRQGVYFAEAKLKEKNNG